MAWLLELKSQKSSLSQSAYYLSFIKDKIFNLVLNSYLNWRHVLAYRLSLKKNNFGGLIILDAYVFAKIFQKLVCLSKCVFKTLTFIFFLYGFCECNPLKILKRQHSSSRENLVV